MNPTICEGCEQPVEAVPANAFPIGGGVAYACDACKATAEDHEGTKLFEVEGGVSR